MYTKAQFGRELQQKTLKRIPLKEIGIWSHTVYIQHVEHIEPGLRRILLTLNTMELGSEFEFSYEELNQIANDLIAGKDVQL